MSKYFIPLLSALMLTTHVFAEESKEMQTEQIAEAPDMSKVSESFGHLISKNLATLSVDFDMELVVKGIRDSLEGKEAPLNENQVVAAITQVQEIEFQKKSNDNLAKAEEFMTKNALRPEVVEVEPGRLQYRVEKAGEGEVVQEGNSPKIMYKGTFLDGETFGESKEGEVISLNETIQGFQKGIAGMKVGEKRTLFIHPELGYGNQGYLPPNSLLTFEIEVLEANVAQPEFNPEEALSQLDEAQEAVE
ncbi:MAG: FKBP-type peptidyl-prolyl cis-trans isomerase [Simkaniaceae bacterium]|nr:FKBP-type peptidyl-prolyl cis-trans isomerase [Simkaniaceae bacterium]